MGGLDALRSGTLKAYETFERAIAPGTRFSQSHYEDALVAAVAGDTDWLDIGCGRRLLPEWRRDAEAALANRAGRLSGVDLDVPSLVDNTTVTDRIKASSLALPFRDASFDLVTANMVMEHILDPVAQFAEAFRVLRPGGRFIFHTPNERAYTTRLARALPEWIKAPAISLLEGRAAEDVFPTYYRANRGERITELARSAGFHVGRIQYVTTGAATAVILPLAVVELLWIRQLNGQRFEQLRHTIIADLVKPT